ncbi:MAG: ATP-dependent 6-phosphofructokinase [Burkholderiaceae bacterium]|nr:ATP-dependent 6-phosphofructokinase [Burkholderiaceae bacterium]
MKVGLLTGGGDCPGLNAVIRAVTRSLLRHCATEVIGIQDGFAGLMECRTQPLTWENVGELVGVGGTILGTTNRLNPLSSESATAQAMANVQALGLDALVAIGGDGTLTIAHGLAQRGLKVVGVPKTIDNDIEGCERSFGFDTAVATVTDALERVHTTGHSHGRVMIVETMGRHAGWIALEAGIAGSANIILLPEIDYDIARVAAVCRQRESKERFTLICMGEGAKPVGGAITWDVPAPGDTGQRRLGGVAMQLRDQLQPLLGSEVRATVLGHVQRGGSPTPFDRVLSSQYGVHAAELVAAGQFGRVVTLTRGALGNIALSRVAAQNRRVQADEPLLHTARQLGVSLGDAEDACLPCQTT